MAASNGMRVTLPSFVGYPKDVVSRKLLQKEVLFGDEAIAKRLSLNLYRPLEHGVLKAREDSSHNDYDANIVDLCPVGLHKLRGFYFSL